MSEYSADFQRILDEELGNYAARAPGELAAIHQKGLVLAEGLLQCTGHVHLPSASSHLAHALGFKGGRTFFAGQRQAA